MPKFVLNDESRTTKEMLRPIDDHPTVSTDLTDLENNTVLI